jgi:pantoate--beta-alanine ligase
MEVVRTIAGMREYAGTWRAAGHRIGLAPTMGYFHEGHLSLMRASVAECDVTVTSLFVNPTQFGPAEDLARYPRDFARDCAMAEAEDVDVMFAPELPDVYPEGFHTYVKVEEWSDRMCGQTRPIHFRGVTTVCCKLFHIVQPHRAYFGQKDAQQCGVIKRMARDLDMGIEIVEMPIVREPDGLAMSSRNAYLSPEERHRGLCLSRSLFHARDLLEAGERDARRIIDAVREVMAGVDIDYVELVDADDFQPVEEVSGKIVLAVAAFAGKTRLIDNIKFGG